MAKKQLDQIAIKKGLDIAEALSAIQFFWNLARHRDTGITVEIWAEREAVVLEKGVIDSPDPQRAIAVG